MINELERITTVVQPTSLVNQLPPAPPVFDDITEGLVQMYGFKFDEISKFREGLSSEKLKKTTLNKMMLEVCLYVIDNAKKPTTDDKKEEIIYIQNKKMVRDLVFSLFTILDNYTQKDTELKVLLLGKLIQSLYAH